MAAALGSQAQLVATVDDLEEARAMLAAGEANVAVVVPDDVVETVRGGEQAVLTILHDQIDPFESSVVELFAQGAVDQVNREVLQELVASGQVESEELEEPLPAARGADHGHVGCSRGRRRGLFRRSAAAAGSQALTFSAAGKAHRTRW